MGVYRNDTTFHNTRRTENKDIEPAAALERWDGDFGG